VGPGCDCILESIARTPLDFADNSDLHTECLGDVLGVHENCCVCCFLLVVL